MCHGLLRAWPPVMLGMPSESRLGAKVTHQSLDLHLDPYPPHGMPCEVCTIYTPLRACPSPGCRGAYNASHSDDASRDQMLLKAATGVGGYSFPSALPRISSVGPGLSCQTPKLFLQQAKLKKEPLISQSEILLKILGFPTENISDRRRAVNQPQLLPAPVSYFPCHFGESHTVFLRNAWDSGAVEGDEGTQDSPAVLAPRMPPTSTPRPLRKEKASAGPVLSLNAFSS